MSEVSRRETGACLPAGRRVRSGMPLVGLPVCVLEVYLLGELSLYLTILLIYGINNRRL